jgi:hypothetical protein
MTGAVQQPVSMPGSVDLANLAAALRPYLENQQAPSQPVPQVPGFTYHPIAASQPQASRAQAQQPAGPGGGIASGPEAQGPVIDSGTLVQMANDIGQQRQQFLQQTRAERGAARRDMLVRGGLTIAGTALGAVYPVLAVTALGAGAAWEWGTRQRSLAMNQIRRDAAWTADAVQEIHRQNLETQTSLQNLTNDLAQRRPAAPESPASPQQEATVPGAHAAAETAGPGEQPRPGNMQQPAVETDENEIGPTP